MSHYFLILISSSVFLFYSCSCGNNSTSELQEQLSLTDAEIYGLDQIIRTQENTNPKKDYSKIRFYTVRTGINSFNTSGTYEIRRRDVNHNTYPIDTVYFECEYKFSGDIQNRGEYSEWQKIKFSSNLK